MVPHSVTCSLLLASRSPAREMCIRDSYCKLRAKAVSGHLTRDYPDKLRLLVTLARQTADKLQYSSSVTSFLFRCHRGTMELRVSTSVYSSYSGALSSFFSSSVCSLGRDLVTSIRMG